MKPIGYKYTVTYFDGTTEEVTAVWPKGAREKCQHPDKVRSISGPVVESLGSQIMDFLVNAR